MEKSTLNETVLGGDITIGELQSAVGVVVKIARLATWRFFGAFAFGTAGRYVAIRYFSDWVVASGTIVAAIIAGALLGQEVDTWRRGRVERSKLDRLVTLVREVLKTLRERAADAAGLNPAERKELAKLAGLIAKVSPSGDSSDMAKAKKVDGGLAAVPDAVVQVGDARGSDGHVVSAGEPVQLAED